jgi:Na+/citrate or Na+/malate symporter
MAYSEILGRGQEEFFAQILPTVMLGSFSAVILAGIQPVFSH